MESVQAEKGILLKGKRSLKSGRAKYRRQKVPGSEKQVQSKKDIKYPFFSRNANLLIETVCMK
jgi:hypothetical protein